MRKSTLLRIALAASLAFTGSTASAFPIMILPYASQITTFQYDASGRLIGVIHSGNGNQCPNSTPTWGVGSFGCFSWTS
jgi:hypothetical protein